MTPATLAQGRVASGVFRFGAPLAIGMLLHGSFNLIDMFMVARLPEGMSALAALGLCDMLAALATIVSQGVSTASVAIVSRHHGAGERTALRRVTWQSLVLVGLLSVGFGLVGLFGSGLMVRDMMGAKGQVATLAVAYLEVMLGGCFSIFFLLQVTALLRALGHAKTAAALLVGGNALNLVLDVFFVFGSGPAPAPFGFGPPIAAALHIPRLGVVGAAWATLIARSVPVVIGLVLIARRRGGPRFHRVYLRPRWREISAILHIAWPSSLELMLRVAAVLAFLALVASRFTTTSDPSVLSAYSICLRLEMMVLFVGLGWGAAASSYVGTNVGASQLERAKRAGYWAALFGALSALIMVGLYVGYADSILAFFDADARVASVGREYLMRVGPSYVLLAVAVVFSQAMAGAGATRLSLWLDAGVLWLLVVPAALLGALVFHITYATLFSVMALGNLLGAMVFFVAYREGSFLRS
ncbi:MAG: MATE family efflux transporter [Deltaproteobacteria bacterium]|nr:MATE family efflux transporter [Deltaproteobacteria bacterium]